MIKNSPLSLLLAFIAGVIIASGYFLLIAPFDQNTDKKHIQSISKASTSTPAPVQTVALAVTEIPDQQTLTDNNDTSRSAEQLQQQVVELKRELATQKAAVKSYQKQLQGPSDFEQMLLDKFDQQNRDEEWAYRTEVALQDFLITADLTITPELVSAECKTSVCKFELVAPQGNEEFDHRQWRELNDKLVKQAFWQQFKTSTSTSSDESFKLLLSTEQ
ncbi:hypothetical protein [Pseudoalteromonas atlantica]|uniref:hypothetical protein n=1 Tax=Pseudoalteromonas atlantica TaxID=288 RepID=UPI003734DD71